MKEKEIGESESINYLEKQNYKHIKELSIKHAALIEGRKKYLKKQKSLLSKMEIYRPEEKPIQNEKLYNILNLSEANLRLSPNRNLSPKTTKGNKKNCLLTDISPIKSKIIFVNK